MAPARSTGKSGGLLLAILFPHRCLKSECEVKNETRVDFFELADKIMEKDGLKPLGGVEVKGRSFIFFMFDFRLNLTIILTPSSDLCPPCSSPS